MSTKNIVHQGEAETVAQAVNDALKNIEDHIKPDAFLLATKDENGNSAVVISADDSMAVYLLIKAVETVANNINRTPQEVMLFMQNQLDDMNKFEKPTFH